MDSTAPGHAGSNWFLEIMVDAPLMLTGNVPQFIDLQWEMNVLAFHVLILVRFWLSHALTHNRKRELNVNGKAGPRVELQKAAFTGSTRRLYRCLTITAMARK